MPPRDLPNTAHAPRARTAQLEQDIADLRAELDEQAALLEKVYKQNKKIAKRLQVMSIVNWVRMIFIYLPLVVLLVVSLFYVPRKIKEIAQDPYGFLFESQDTQTPTSTGMLRELFSRFSPSELKDVQDVIREFQPQ